MTAAAAPESILACADEATDEATGAVAVAAAVAAAVAVADMLAAMAAAAIANGAVALPEVGGEVGGAAGVSVTAMVTGIAVAMAVATVAAFCCADAVASVEEPAAEVSPDDDFAVDLPASDFELPDIALEVWGASALVSELAPEGGAAGGAEAFWLVESLLAGGAAAPFCDPPLFAAAGALSESDCQAGCGGAAAAELFASPAVLLSSSAPKISFPELESDLAARGGAL
jgi:hypothetical protein